MAYLGLEGRIADRNISRTYSSDSLAVVNNTGTMTASGFADNLSHKINFNQPLHSSDSSASSQSSSSTAQSYAFSPSLRYQIESLAPNGDYVFMRTDPCSGKQHYEIFRHAKNVGTPLEIDSRFADANAENLVGIEDALFSMYRIKQEMEAYAANGNLSRLKQFAASKMMNTPMLKMPDIYNTSGLEGVVAATYTMPHLQRRRMFVLGAGKNFDEGLEGHATAIGVPNEYIVELALSEELMHQAQYRLMGKVAKKGYVALIEGHVKGMLSLYFYQRAMENPSKRENYLKVSKALYNWYANLVYAHVKLFGIEISDLEFKTLIETKSPDEVAEILGTKKKATRRPDPCKEGDGYMRRAAFKSHGKRMQKTDGNEADDDSCTEGLEDKCACAGAEDYGDSEASSGEKNASKESSGDKIPCDESSSEGSKGGDSG